MIAPATIGYEPWPPLIGAALDEAQLTGVVVVPFVGVRCVLVERQRGWTLPAASIELADGTWRGAVERVLRVDAHLGMCDTTPFAVVRSSEEDLSVVAWAECAVDLDLRHRRDNTSTVHVDEAARLLAPAWPLGAQLCCMAARLRRNTCHRPITG